MKPTRRQFLRVALTGAVALPLTGKALASSVLARRPQISLSDDLLLEELERAASEFFWNEVHPATGLIMDKANANGSGSPGIASIAATGFGLTALCIGHERNYRPQSQIEQRVAKTLRFLAQDAQVEHGFLYHFVDPSNGKRVRTSEISPIDNSILLCGVLTCREYFQSGGIKRDATTIFNRVEWPWALNGGDTFVMFTDGVTEARNERDEEFGEPRLLACLGHINGSQPEAVVKRVFSEVRAFCHDAEQTDDITVTATRFVSENSK